MLRQALKAAVARRSVGSITAFVAPVVLFGILLGPALVGRATFAAVDLVEQRSPWSSTSTIDHITNGCVADTVDTILPGYFALRDRLSAGDAVPLWDPLPAAGRSVEATIEYGYLSPIVLASLPSPPNYAPVIFKLLELILIGLGMWLWFRLIGISRSASMVASLVFATSGFMVMWTNWPQTRTAAFFPLVFWGAERIVKGRSIRSAWPLALTLASLVVSGFPAVAVHGIYAAMAYAIVRLVADGLRDGAPRKIARSLKVLAIGIGAVLVGLGTIAFQLLATAQQLSETDLGYRTHQWMATLSSLQAITTVFGLGLGTCGKAGRWGSVIPIEGNFFIGAGALVLVMAAIALPRAASLARGVRAFMIGAAALTVGAIFLGGPISYALHFLPYMDNSLMPRARGIAGLFFAVLAGIGYDAIRNHRSKTPTRLGWFTLGAVPVALGLVTLLTVDVGAQESGFRATTLSVAVGVGSAVIVWVAWVAAISPHFTRVRVIAIALIPIAIAAEGWFITNAFWPRVPDSELYRQTDTTTYLAAHDGEDRMVPVAKAFWATDGEAYGLRTVTAHTFVTPEWRALIEAIDPDAFLTPTYSKFFDPSAMSNPLLDRLSGKYFVLPFLSQPLGSRVPVDTGLTAGALGSGETLTFEVPVGRLRGIDLRLAKPVVGGDLTVTASDGTTTVSTTVPLKGRTALIVPLTGEAMRDSGRITVKVTHTSPAPLALASDTAGGPVVDAVYGTDGYTLVRAVDAAIYLRPTSLERIRWATAFRAYTSTDEFLSLASSEPPATVLLDSETARTASISGAGATVDVVADGGDTTKVDVVAAGDGLLVIGDAWRAQQRAYLDGERVPLVRVDSALMGVAVPAGTHVVEVRYQPAGWGLPLRISGFLLLLTLGVAGWDVATRVRRRRRGAVAEVEESGLGSTERGDRGAGTVGVRG